MPLYEAECARQRERRRRPLEGARAFLRMRAWGGFIQTLFKVIDGQSDGAQNKAFKSPTSSLKMAGARLQRQRFEYAAHVKKKKTLGQYTYCSKIARKVCFDFTEGKRSRETSRRILKKPDVLILLQA